jgi:hypothetical protein
LILTLLLLLGLELLYLRHLLMGKLLRLRLLRGLRRLCLRSRGRLALLLLLLLRCLGLNGLKKPSARYFEKMSSALRQVLHQHAEFVPSAEYSAGFVHPVFFEPSQYLGYSLNLSLLSVD